jgi:MarR-like DNA-binding transcriptional regulator SgrR of sgrS sRNA
MKTHIRIGLAVLLFALPGSVTAGVLTVSLEKAPGDVHPIRSNTLEAVLMGNQVYEPLVGIGPSGQILPVLLQQWNYEPAKRKFQFMLKENVHFSDGTVLSSAHVVKTFKDIIAANRVQNFSRIKGAAKFAESGKGEVAGLTIQDGRRFSIELDVAYPRFLADLADPYASVFLESKRSSLPLGTGPYMFKKAAPSSTRVTLQRSPTDGSSKEGFETIVFTSDKKERADIYLAEPENPSDVRLRKFEYLDTEVVFLAFNAANRTLADLRTRRSLGALLTDAAIDAALGPVAYKVGGYIPFGTAGYNPGLAFPGAPEPRSLPAAVTIVSYMPRLTPLAESYCKILEANGVSCRLKITSVDDMYKAKADGSLQLVLLRQKSTTYSVEYLLSCFTSLSACNLFTTKESNPEISRRMDDYFDRMLRTSADDKGALLGLYKEMDAAVLTSALVRPIRYGVNKAIWSDRSLLVPALDTLGPFGMKLGNVRSRN